MNISYNWLKEYVDFELTAQEVADALTSEGLEVGCVEEVQPVKGGLQGLVIGEVLTCMPHPNSDHMHVCTVRRTWQPDRKWWWPHWVANCMTATNVLPSRNPSCAGWKATE